MTEEKKEKKEKKYWLTDNLKDWLTDHLAFLRGLKSPSDTQKLFLLLAEKEGRTAQEERTLETLVKGEKAIERAKKAQAAVSSIVKTESEKLRSARNHQLIQLGLLFGYAEIDQAPRDFLMGLLLMGSQTDEFNRQKLSQIGADFFAKKEPKKEKAPVATAAATDQIKAPAAPAPAVTSAAPSVASTRTYLTSEKSEKEEIKALGGRWDPDRLQWFVPPGADLTPFKKWIS